MPSSHTNSQHQVIRLGLLIGTMFVLATHHTTDALMRLGRATPTTATTKNLIETALLKFTQINNEVAGGGAKDQMPCTCGVFLSGQFKKGSPDPPKGNPALLHEQDVMLPCTAQGVKMCTNRCLEVIVKYLPNSPNIICGTIDRDCHRERAYLFVQNCNGTWINTNLSAGREYCCKDGTYVKCPLAL